MTTIRVLIADDHPIVRDGLRAVLTAEPDLEVIGECASGDEAVALAEISRPDVVLMDLRMPGGDGFTATERIVAGGYARVLVLTTYDHDEDILRAVEAGATGYLLKDTPRGPLAEAVRTAARGEPALAAPVAALLVDRLRTGSRSVLTPRETEVLRCVAEGLSNPRIARELFISEGTVKTHLLRLFAKLGVGDRTSAVTTAMARGILPPPGRR
ncbi:response regulator [Actinomadura sp. HBU206391]|uniref:response regulator n=1 Tax=Actinomadura sp. HBU206391 TaxID=2731692 RepID=UPI00165071C2|nr:response regulator transcription factor [Actinomadura sp. HBU206391]MBC6462145.1 response regulator transcription factor [Actinomadura sp. HBU206391]